LEVINHYKEFDDQEINKIYCHMKNIEDSKEEKKEDKEDKEYIINGLNPSSSDDKKSEVNFNSVGLSFNDFFNLFIALNYIQGKKALDIERFKRYIKKYYDDNIDVTEKLNNAISDLEKQQIIKRIAERDDVIFINDSIPVTPLISKNGNYVNQVLKVIDHYHNYEIKEIDKLYYLMCDHPEKNIK
ncbi:MAG: hypothetical protein J6X02_01370, partial [Bacilli bacterium]|nr:hypothetical protein [Bacilli bacterium]